MTLKFCSLQISVGLIVFVDGAERSLHTGIAEFLRILDGDSSHMTGVSLQLADELNILLVWVSPRCTELNADEGL